MPTPEQLRNPTEWLVMIKAHTRRLQNIKRETEIDEAPQHLGFNDHHKSNWTAQKHGKTSPAGIWAFISQFSI